MAIPCLRALSPLHVEVCEEATKRVDLARGVGDSGREHCLLLSLRFVAFRREPEAVQRKWPNCPVGVDRQTARLFPSPVAAGRRINQSIVMHFGLDKIFVITNPQQLTVR